MKRVNVTTDRQQRLDLDYAEAEEILAPLQSQWTDALEKAKANRTVFAQRAIRPEEVMPEWQKQQQALGTQDDVQRFVQSACARLNAPLEKSRRQTYKLLPGHLPEALQQRMADEGLIEEGDKTLATKGLMLDFAELHRSHPLVTVLADHLIETALQGDSSVTARCAATETDAVQVVTTVYLLRLRHQLSYVRRKEPYQMMAEETMAVAVQGRTNPVWLSDESVSQLLQSTPTSNLPRELITREIQQSLDFAKANQSYLEQLAKVRAQALLEDHRRVREAARDVGQYSVTPCLPVDVIGVYVLLPELL